MAQAGPSSRPSAGPSLSASSSKTVSYLTAEQLKDHYIQRCLEKIDSGYFERALPDDYTFQSQTCLSHCARIAAHAAANSESILRQSPRASTGEAQEQMIEFVNDLAMLERGRMDANAVAPGADLGDLGTWLKTVTVNMCNWMHADYRTEEDATPDASGNSGHGRTDSFNTPLVIRTRE